MFSPCVCRSRCRPQYPGRAPLPDSPKSSHASRGIDVVPIGTTQLQRASQRRVACQYRCGQTRHSARTHTGRVTMRRGSSRRSPIAGPTLTRAKSSDCICRVGPDAPAPRPSWLSSRVITRERNVADTLAGCALTGRAKQSDRALLVAADPEQPVQDQEPARLAACPPRPGARTRSASPRARLGPARRQRFLTPRDPKEVNRLTHG